MNYTRALALSLLLVACRKVPENPLPQQQAPIIVQEERLSGTIIDYTRSSMMGDDRIMLNVQTQYGVKHFEIRCNVKGVIRKSYHDHVTYDENSNLEKYLKTGMAVTLDSADLHKDAPLVPTCLDELIFGN